MQDHFQEFLSEKIKRANKRRIRAIALLTLAALIITGVSWQLRLTGITMTDSDQDNSQNQVQNPSPSTPTVADQPDATAPDPDLLGNQIAANAADVGDDNMDVEYYVFINGKWEKVGATTKGYVSAYNGGTSSPNGNHDRDYLTEENVASILGKYGFQSSGNSARTIFYQPLSAKMDSMVWSDTTTVEHKGKRIIPLSIGARNYRIYFAPSNTHGDNLENPNHQTILNNGNIFFSVDVFDPQRLVFKSDAECNAKRLVFRSGSTPIITLPKPSVGSWMLIHDGGEVNPRRDDFVKDNGDGTVTIKVPGLSQRLRLSPDGTTDYGPDKRTVDYFVYIDGAWHVVGQTNYFWKGNYGLNNMNNMDCRDQISVDQIYGVLGPYGFDIGNLGNVHKLAYQQKGDDKCYSDTMWDKTAGHNMLPLSQNQSGSGYNIYYLPGNSSPLNGVSGGSLPLNGNRFYSITVHDGQHWLYSQKELDAINKLEIYNPQNPVKRRIATAVQANGRAEVTVDRAGWTWMWTTPNLESVIEGDQSIEFTYPNPNDQSKITMIMPTVTRQLLLTAGDSSLHETASTGSMEGDKTVVHGQGITFKLFNYRRDINEYFKQVGLADTPYFPNAANQLDVYNNSKNYFAFRNQATPWKSETQSYLYDKDGYWIHENGKPNHATVQPALVNGYPVLDLTHRGTVAMPAGISTADLSLAVLFGGVSSPYVRSYNCKNTLLQFVQDASQQVTVDGMTYKPGYFYYDSRLNAADYNTDTDTWYVRNFVERGADTAYNYFKYYDFLPFNNRQTISDPLHTLPDHTGGTQTYNYENRDVDYWFGMSMTVNFFQGMDGKVEHNGVEEPMKFHFSGDDDVWVYIDDALVLDIGGTHGAVDGFIDFSTGLVTTKYNFAGTAGGTGDAGDRRYSSTTLYECYKALLDKQRLTDAQKEARLNEIFIRDYTAGEVTDEWGNKFPIYRFKNYSSHRLNFFYLERGAAAANCAMSFNLPTLPNEALIVGKELDFVGTGMSPKQIEYAKNHLEYRFRVVDVNGKPIFSNDDATVWDESLEEYLGVTHIDADGWFTLKGGQRVIFEDMLKAVQLVNDVDLQYFVEEAIPAAMVDQYTGVIYKDGGTSGEITMEGVTGSDWVVYKTNPLSPENTYTVVYTNRVDVEKLSYLEIGKEVLDGWIWNGTDTFDVEVIIGDKPVEVGTVFVDTVTHEEIKVSREGILTLKHGQVVRMVNPLISGTHVVVREVAKSGWIIHGYVVTHNGAQQTGNYSNGLDERIPVDTVVRVLIQNKTQQFTADLFVSKEFEGYNAGANIDRFATFKIEQLTGLNGTVNKDIGQIDLTIHGDETVFGKIVIPFGAEDPGSYYYKITELSATGGTNELMILDDTVYIVEIEVTQDVSARVVAIYKDGQKIATSDTVAFVNTLGTKELPKTGGAGTEPFIFGGLLLMALPLVYVSSRRRHGRRESI